MSESPWRRLVVDVGVDASEAVQGVLLDAGAIGIEVEDDETRAMPGRALAPTGRATVIATFSREPGIEARAAAALAQVVPHLHSARDMDIAWSDLEAEDWNAAFKAQWKPLRFTTRTFVVPSWEEENFTAPDDAVSLLLDPGIAFGTGTHQTTRLCGQALDDHLAEGHPIESLLDVGTGSGILCVLALKLGAKVARGTDIDPAAVRAALENAARNEVAGRFSCGDELPDHWGESHDAVVANILAEPLLGLAHRIVGALRRGGQLWLSGLLVEQREAIVSAYEALGMRCTGSAVDEGWLRLDFKKP
ncbi:MAG: 50S ribosomal protein L11 methyltransferase [Myxococcota bacterium]